MGVAEAEFGGKAVGGGTAFAEGLFDGAAKSETNAIEVARDAGFVFGELSADFGEGLLLGVVEAQSLFIAGIEGCERGVQGTDKKRDVAFPIGVERLDGNGLRDFVGARFCVVLLEGFKAAGCANGVNMTLGENGA